MNIKLEHLVLLAISTTLAILFLLSSCTKETQQQQTNCECYELHEYKDYNAQQAQIIWMYDYSTTPQADLCAKDDGQWKYSGNASQFRYKTICK